MTKIKYIGKLDLSKTHVCNNRPIDFTKFIKSPSMSVDELSDSLYQQQKEGKSFRLAFMDLFNIYDILHHVNLSYVIHHYSSELNAIEEFFKDHFEIKLTEENLEKSNLKALSNMVDYTYSDVESLFSDSLSLKKPNHVILFQPTSLLIDRLHVRNDLGDMVSFQIVDYSNEYLKYELVSLAKVNNQITKITPFKLDDL